MHHRDPMPRGTHTLVFVCLVPLCTAHAADAPSADRVERIEIQSSSILPTTPNVLAGDFELLTRTQLDERRPFSALEALRELPGLTVVAEDTAGTHLNIGLRGLNPRRSSRLLLLEDGAPTVFFATYGDPSSHYATPLHRIERIELVKGASQVLHGPQTLGGMLNFVTRGVPRSGLVGGAQFSAGNQGYRDVTAHLGLGGASGGWVVDWGQRRGQGVRAEHGYDLRDLALKGQWRLNADQTMTAKWARFEETSRFSETGFTAAEFLANPRGVAGTQGERFLMSRDVAQWVHDWRLSSRAKLSTQAYYSRVQRESQRLREFEPDDAETGLGELAIEPAIRPRHYRIAGVEPRLRLRYGDSGVHELVLGARAHREQLDRQKFLTDGLRGPIREADERLTVDVMARSGHVQNRLVFGDWTWTQGVRWEDIDQDKRLFKADANAAAPRFSSTPVSGLNSRQRLWLPGLGITWDGPSMTTVFAGIHRGFAPARPDRDIADDVLQRVKPEVATIAELGLRSSRMAGLQWGLTVFDMKIDDIVVQAGGVFRNEGQARHTGMELDARLSRGPMSLSLQYTLLATAKFLGSGVVGGEGEDGYGAYQSGNRLPYTPRHTLGLSATLRLREGWRARVGAQHTSAQFANTENLRGTSARGFCPAGDQPDDSAYCGLYGEVPSLTLFNANLSYTLPNRRASYFVSVENLADTRTIVSRTNGIQPGRGRLVWGGVRLAF